MTRPPNSNGSSPVERANKVKLVIEHPFLSGVAATIIAAIVISMAVGGWHRVRNAISPASALLNATVEPFPGPALSCQGYGRLTGRGGVPTPAAANDQLSPGEVDLWIRRAGLIAVVSTELEVRIQGRSAQAVVLDELRVVIDSAAPASARDHYYLMMGCGGGYEPRSFQIDLDSKTPEAVPTPGSDGIREFPAMSFPLVVSDAESETLILRVAAAKYDVSWHLEIPWYSGTERDVLTIRPPGAKSFTLAGDQVERTHRLSPDGRTWLDVEATR
ncbi:hypothetical protein MLP_07920 [Microlunatus phosphovorus NM-1]|uniref:Uncharacterized protein n=1 Tax=Microlunatus phosphovorus (strain ATCC 700054 / DSM 10555 / JCM 9379 / NBRC 101784 / NCIMB 13414 / VKM Ac-1990 / NM-1) TaxID=1032480 RepID=F5XLS7_MICPN|nr:hypothetical protein [Microlunatus phosphovorus]BAK33806.1 hypothetical protein MLP_07920 [Microlunatus phosphovorus NM-1]